MRIPLTSFLTAPRRCATAFGIASALACAVAGADPLAVIDPLPPGPYVVACSNVEQDFSRVLPGETAKDYWEGVPDGSRQRYVTQLFVDPVDALTVNVNVPDDRELFVNHARQQVATALLVCYPTAPSNPRPDYLLPTGTAVPHMQRGAEAPIWADPGVRWPVLVFSHGLVGSPLSNDYILALTTLASYGYVLVAPFHGDPRFADIKIDNLGDAIYAALHFPTYVEMQAIRPCRPRPHSTFCSAISNTATTSTRPGSPASARASAAKRCCCRQGPS
jgi:hypothetical protein